MNTTPTQRLLIVSVSDETLVLLHPSDRALAFYLYKGTLRGTSFQHLQDWINSLPENKPQHTITTERIQP